MTHCSYSCQFFRLAPHVVRRLVSCISCAVLLVVLGVQPSPAAQGKWSATVSGDEATAANCSDCNEDIGLLLSCKRGSPDVQVSLMLLEQPEDFFAGKPVVVSVTSEAGKLAIAATYGNPGLIGPYPNLSVPQGSPFLNLLARSSSVTFFADRKKTELGMSGSKAAIARMYKACR